MAKTKEPSRNGHNQVSDNRTSASEQIFSSSIFSIPRDLYEHALSILSTTTSHQDVIYEEIPPIWAQTVLDQLGSKFGNSFR